MTKMTTVSASKKGGAAKKGKLRSMRIETAQNGFTTHNDYEPAGDGKEPYWGPSEKPAVHADVESMLDHVRQSFGGKKKPAGGKPAMPAKDTAGMGQNDADKADAD